MNPTQHHFIHIPNILESAMSFGPSSRAANIAGACCRTLSCSAPHKMMAAFWDAQYMDWSSIPTLECCCCSVTQMCPTLWDLTECNTPSFPILYYLSNFALTHVLWVSDAIQQSHSLSHPLSCPQSFPASGSFSNKSAFCIRWPKYWSFNFSVSPSNEYSGLISFRVDWFELFPIQVILLQHHSSKASVLQDSAQNVLPSISKKAYQALYFLSHEGSCKMQ